MVEELATAYFWDTEEGCVYLFVSYCFDKTKKYLVDDLTGFAELYHGFLEQSKYIT